MKLHTYDKLMQLFLAISAITSLITTIFLAYKMFMGEI